MSGPFALSSADSAFTFTSVNLSAGFPELTFGDAPPIGGRARFDDVAIRYWRSGAAEAGSWYALGDFQSEGLALPGLKQPVLGGSLHLSGEGLRGTATLLIGGAAHIAMELRHRFETANGSVEFAIPEFRFDGGHMLSDLVEPLPPEFDITAGNISGAGWVEWGGLAPGRFGGGATLAFADLNGHFGETHFEDFDSVAEVEITAEGALRNAAPLEATLGAIDPGLPLTELRWNYGFDSAEQVLEIQSLEAAALDGAVSLPALRLGRGAPLPEVNLILTDINLAAVTALAKYDEVAVTGRVSGDLLLRFQAGRIRIEDGLIGALDSGGTIRYTPTQASTDPRMQAVNEFLSDYHFETLTSRVNLDEAGDLLLQVEMVGANPALNPDQPIHLNLSISDNIPQLLRSLRTGRKISRSIERQTNDRQ